MNASQRTIRNVLPIVALLWTTAAPAQCVNGTCTIGGPPAVVRVIHTLGPCRTYGTGTIIHDDGHQAIVLSCAHLFREGTGQVQVRLSNGRTVPARPKSIDTTWDLSTLEIDSVGITPVSLAAKAPQPGQQLRSCGFGPNGIYRCNTGTAQGYASGSNGKTYETLCLTGSARDGDSGGPVLNQHGELVGVLWGTDGRTVHATYCGRIRRFLANLLPGLGSSNALANKPPALNPTPPTPTDNQFADRFETIARQLEQSAQQQKNRDTELGSRLERLEKLVGTIGAIRDRLDSIENSPAASDLRSKARETVGDAARTGISKLLTAALPGLLTALGWSTPPSLAAILALRIGLRVLRRRRVRRKRFSRRRSPRAKRSPTRAKPDTQLDPRTCEQAAHESKTRTLRPLNDQYAEQLNELYTLSGRSPTADATLGREYDRELREMESAADDTTSRWAHNLRQRVADRFLRIHDQSPLPAEPTKQTA